NDQPTKALYYTWPLGGLKNVALSPGDRDLKCVSGTEEKLPSARGKLYYGREGHPINANVYQQVGEDIEENHWFKRFAALSAPDTQEHRSESVLFSFRSAPIGPGASVTQDHSTSTSVGRPIITTYRTTVIIRESRRLLHIIPLPSSKSRLRLNIT